MTPTCCSAIVVFSLALLARGGACEKLTLPPSPQMTRADIYVDPYKGKACATLILCPGRNGNGQDLISDPKWVQFAQEQKVNLVGLSFASDDNPEDLGYFRVSSGSGQILINGLNREFGSPQPKLLLFGFSRGAQFTDSFCTWRPDLVMAWCAYSATEWCVPAPVPREPKGIIACGEEDESNYSFSVLQFLKGRSMEKPWTWISLAHTGHVLSPALEDFVRSYFASILAHPTAKGVWMDVDTKSPVERRVEQQNPTLAAWLPDADVAGAWRAIHQP
jgi:hypothetical protein